MAYACMGSHYLDTYVTIYNYQLAQACSQKLQLRGAFSKLWAFFSWLTLIFKVFSSKNNIIMGDFDFWSICDLFFM